MTPTRNSHGSGDRDLHSTRRAFLFAREQIAAHTMGLARDGDPAADRQRSARRAGNAPDAAAG